METNIFKKIKSHKFFSIGESISEDLLKSDDLLAVLKGKIRVLKTSNSGQEQTVLCLLSGDIWNPAMYSLGFLASEDVEICQIPQNLAKEEPYLIEQLNKTQIKINQALESFDKFDESLEKNTSNYIYEENITQDNTNNTEILRQIFDFYKYSQAKKNFYKINSFDELQKKLETLNFKVKKQYYRWNKLLNAKFPLVLEDDKGILRWIVDKKGNTLLEERENEFIRFIPENEALLNKFNALTILSAPCKKEFKFCNPFSTSWYLKLLINNKLLTAQMIFSSFLVQIFTLGMPLFYMVIFDRAFGRQNLSTLDVMAIGLGIVLIFDFFIKLIRSYILSHLLESIDKISIETLLKSVLTVSFTELNKEIARNFSNRFSELVKVNQIFINTIMISSLDAVFSIFVVFVLLLINFKLALISLAPIIPIGIITFWSSPKQKKRILKFSQSQSQNQLKLSEILENNETVQSINANNHIFKNFLNKTNESLKNNFSARFDQIYSGTSLSFISNVGSLITLYVGAHEVLEGKITFGIYLAINMLSRSYIGTIQKLLSSLQQFFEATDSIQQLKNIFSNKKICEDGTQKIFLNKLSGHIACHDLCFRYQQELPLVLNNLNLEIRPGQKIILTGKNGSGKTTLIRLLQKLYEPASGYICLDGYNFTDIDTVNLRNNIGVALQKPGIFSGTIRENICLGNQNAGLETILEAISIVQLNELLIRLPKGLDTTVVSMGANLSGGQIAQIALARVLLMNPKILIIDEALSALDFSLQAKIFSIILEKYKNNTCIFVTDYIPVHKRADRIVFLHEGHIVEQGTYNELVKLKGYYYNLHSNGLIGAG
ncbi:MAG: peptidase domain-containing ABC transporter [bacterium]